MTSFLLGRNVIFLGMILPALMDQASTIPLGRTIPEACAREITPATGQPYMASTKGVLQFGLSSRPSTSSKVPLAIWVSNPTNEQAAVLTCSDLEFFFIKGLDVFDHDGIRVLSKQEANARGGPDHRNGAWGCGRNILIVVPPHSCMHGNFDKPDYDFVKDLSEIYSLTPGLYTITSKIRAGEQKQITEGLTVQVIP